MELRYFNAAWAAPDGEIGEDHDPESHLIPLVIGAALGTRPPVKIFGTDYSTPDGTAVRDYVHVMDLADAHLRAIERLRAGIREHRDSSGHDLCWYHPRLWNLLPEGPDALPVVPDWPTFLRGCLRFRESLDSELPDAKRSDIPFTD